MALALGARNRVFESPHSDHIGYHTPISMVLPVENSSITIPQTIPLSEQVDTLGFDPREDGAVPSGGVLLRNEGYKNKIMNEHVGKDVGIYYIESLCNKRDSSGQKLYHVKCKYCGFESDMRLYNVKQPTVCKHKDRTGNYIDFSSYWKNKRLQTIFSNMKDRCLNPNNKSYRWYGGKGIKIYSEWLDNPLLFEEWALDNGYNDGLTINRIDENKDYSPDNCEWIDNEQNAKYKSTTSMIDVDGEVHTGKDWSKILGLGINTINRYIRKYGLNNTIEFIRKYLKNPNLKPINNNCSIYSVYMN